MRYLSYGLKIAALLAMTGAVAQTAGTVYQATLAGKAIAGSPFASLTAAQTAEKAAGPGIYSNTPYTTSPGAATTYLVSSPQSASGTTLIAPTSSLIVDATGNSWGVANGQVTLNGIADPSTQAVIEMAYVVSGSVGTVWQESTAAGTPKWWGTTVVPASWLPAGGATTSPIAAVVTPPPPPPPPAAPTVSLSASPTTIASGSNSTLTWSSTNATSCTSSGAWSGALATSGSKTTTALTSTSTYSLACTGAGGSSAVQSTTVTVTPAVTPPTGSTATRPSYNTGNGFFVLSGKLYDANGKQFMIRGVDRAHYDDNPQPGLSLTHANAARVLNSNQYGASDATLVADMQKYHVAYKEVPIPMFTDWGAGTDTSCNSTPAALSATVAHWVSSAAQWTTLNKYSIVNLANEWGPTNSTIWRDSNITAIGQMRAAGYTGALMVDAGGCGQDINDLLNYSTAVEAGDPQHNIVFSLHIYGENQAYPPGLTAAAALAQVTPWIQQLNALSKTNGAVYVVGEFGPGNGIGPSPTNLMPADLMNLLDANGIGWLAWAWDDNNLANCGSNNLWFSMTFKCGVYTGLTTDLTLFGNIVVPKLSSAVAATIF